MKVYDNLKLLIKKKGRIQDPETFQRKVNEIFHNIESEYYDGFHGDMWTSLGAVFTKLSDKISETGGLSSEAGLHLLDIGSGTGLSTELFLRTNIAGRISKITLLDSSPGMIEVSGKRSVGWNRKVSLINGYIEKVPSGNYDIILCCSVLHHIPDLESFFKCLSDLQPSGGIFIHLQDPNGDALKSKDYIERLRQMNMYKAKNRKKRSLFSLLYNTKRRLFGEDFNSRVNSALLSQGVIRKRLNNKELWSVTDVHVENLPYSTNEGITISGIAGFLPSYSLKYKTSYAFFGELMGCLPEEFKETEAALSLKDNMEGRHLAGIWQKN